MANLDDYSSEKLMKANEIQLKEILRKYKSQHLPLWKFGLFVSYNAVSLVGMYYYGVKLRGKRLAPAIASRQKLSLARLFSKGVQHSFIMICIYVTGLCLVSYNTISLSLLRKLTEIQSTYHSFGLKFDPNYQEHLLFSRMRKFDISESLIQQIKDEISRQKQQLTKTGGLSADTLQKIKEAEELFKNRQSQLS